MVVALFVFSFFSCSSDEETGKTTFFDYKTAFTAHEWEISSAEQHLGYLLLDVKEAPTYCRFTSDSIYFSEKEMVYHFDADGKITKSGYEISPCGSYPYTIKDDEIKIENQIFTITSTGDSYGTISKEALEHSIICTAPSKTFNLAGMQLSNVFIANENYRN